MITIKDLTFSYKKNSMLFSGLSADIKAGSITGLLGKNGAGKTSLLHLIAGLLFPKNGTIRVNNMNPFERKPEFLSDLSMIPEEFSFPSVSIDCYIKALSPLYPAFSSEKMDSILEKFELNRTDQLNKLSHGQRKKFLIAFSLSTNCKVLILDEPTNGLDIPSKSAFRKILVNSVSDEQTVIISTHQVKDIEAIIDNIVIVDHGIISYQDTTENICRKYNFETIQSPNDVENPLYMEKVPMGYKVITPAKGQNESVIDMELFFNAVINKSI